MLLSQMRTKTLKEMAIALYQVCYVVGCYGVKDLINYERACQELERRGYAIQEHAQLHIVKD